MKPAYLISDRNSNASPDFVTRPGCRNGSLGVNGLGVDYQIVETDNAVPNAGQIIHARTRKSDRPEIPFFMRSPRLSSEFSLSYDITNVNSVDIDDGHHEFRVVYLN